MKMHNRFQKDKPFVFMLLSYWLFVICLAFLCLLSMASAFVGAGCVAPDEERLVVLKPVVHFSFTYGVLRGLVCN